MDRLAQLWILLCCIFNTKLSIAATLPDKAYWVIVFDAGSTKTRMNMFQFRMESKTTKWLPLKHISKKWKPALSQYNPNKPVDAKAIAINFQKLFSIAKSTIPEKKHCSTPVFLYATAGLRGLSVKTSTELLRLSRMAINQSNFGRCFKNDKVPRVKILSGKEEGLYAWWSINYLLSSNMDDQTSKDDVGVVDLGGGSTQISFRPEDEQTAEEANISMNSLTRVSDGHGPGVYSQSFPSYGLSSTIMKYVGAYAECRSKKKCPSDKVFYSKCFRPGFDKTMHFGPYHYKVKAKDVSSNERFKVCTEKARSIVNKIPDHEIQILLRHDNSIFFGIAGYFYVAREIYTYTDLKSEIKISNEKSYEGCYQMNLTKFHEGAKKICTNMPTDNKNSFLDTSCIRSSYVSVLLKEFYKFRSNTHFYICKSLPTYVEGKKHKMDAGWPLGVAQMAAENVIEEKYFSAGSLTSEISKARFIIAFLAHYIHILTTLF